MPIDSAQNSFVFPAYLRGMETIIGIVIFIDISAFPAYLRGMETAMDALGAIVGGAVPSLPKRNGNGSIPKNSSTPSKFPAYLRGMETCSAPSYSNLSNQFPAYLRGMETSNSPITLIYALSSSQPT